MTARSRQQLKANIAQFMPDNDTQDISPADARARHNDIADSAFIARDDAAGITGRGIKGSYTANKLNLDISLFRGGYDNQTEYQGGDSVFHNNAIYHINDNSVASTRNEPGINNSDWTLAFQLYDSDSYHSGGAAINLNVTGNNLIIVDCYGTGDQSANQVLTLPAASSVNGKIKILYVANGDDTRKLTINANRANNEQTMIRGFDGDPANSVEIGGTELTTTMIELSVASFNADDNWVISNYFEKNTGASANVAATADLVEGDAIGDANGYALSTNRGTQMFSVATIDALADGLYLWFEVRGETETDERSILSTPVSVRKIKAIPTTALNPAITTIPSNQRKGLEGTGSLPIALTKYNGNYYVVTTVNNLNSGRLYINKMKAGIAGSAPVNPPAQYDPPVLSNLAITGIDPNNPPLAGSAISGQRTISANLTNPQNVAGNMTLTLQRDAGQVVTIDNAIPASADISEGFAFPNALGNFVAGSTYTFELSGTDTQNPGVAFSTSYQITIASSHEIIYYGSSNNNAFSTIDLAGLTQVDAQNSGTTFNIAQQVPNLNWLIILTPTDRDIVSAINPLGQDEIGRFTTTNNVRQIGGTQYNAHFRQNQSGVDGSYRLQLTTE